jgi:hypothetical protein
MDLQSVATLWAVAPLGLVGDWRSQAVEYGGPGRDFKLTLQDLSPNAWAYFKGYPMDYPWTL